MKSCNSIVRCRCYVLPFFEGIEAFEQRNDPAPQNVDSDDHTLSLSNRRCWSRLGFWLALIGYLSQLFGQFLIVSGIYLTQTNSSEAMERERLSQFHDPNLGYYSIDDDNQLGQVHGFQVKSQTDISKYMKKNEPSIQKLQGSQKNRMISNSSIKIPLRDSLSLKSQQMHSPRTLSSSLKSSRKSYRTPKTRLNSTTHTKENISPFYKDAGHPLTHKFWKKKDLSDRLNRLRDSVEGLKADIVESKESPTEFCQPYLETCSSILKHSNTDLSLLGCEVHLMLEDEMPEDFGPKHTPAVIKLGDHRPYDLFVSTPSGVKRIHAPDEIELGNLDTFFQNHYMLRRQFLPWNHPIMKYITSQGGHNPSISICDDPATNFSVKNLKGGSGCDLTILSRKGANIIAIKKFDNLEEGLNELFYSLVGLGMNLSPNKLKMARIYDAIIYPENCLNLVMEGANSGVIHDYLSTEHAEDVIVACANYFARFHVKSYLKRKGNIDNTKYIKHAAWSHNTTIGDPFKEGLQEKASLDLLTGQQWISNDIESIKSDNVVRLLPEQDQENFAHLVKGVKDRFEENSKEIFRLEKIYNSKLQVPYFLTTTHGDAHGNNFFYFYVKNLLSHDSKLPDDLFRLVTMIDVGKIVRTCGNIGDPAEDVGRFLGSLWDWFFLQDPESKNSENIISRAKIKSLQSRFIESYLKYIKDSHFISEREFERFEKVFLENCEFFKLRFYRAIFNFIKDKDKEKDKKMKLKVLESWMEENGINSRAKQVAIYWSLKEIFEEHIKQMFPQMFPEYIDIIKNCTLHYYWSNNVAFRLQNYHKLNAFNNEPIHRHWTKINDSTRVIHRLLNRPVGFIESSSEKLPQSYLTRLWEELQSTGSAIISSSAVIAGMGGIGKTSLALEYAYEALDNNAYNLIYLIFSETEASLLKGYRYLLHDLQVPIKGEDDDGIYKLIKQKVPNYGKCLLIYDNVPYPGFLDDKVPPNTDILITSRRSQGWDKAPIGLEVFRLEDSIKYLFNILALEENSENRVLAEKLAKTLYNFPLALSHAAHYIRLVGGKSESGIRSTIERYIKDFIGKPEIHFMENEDPFKANELEMTYKNLIGKTYSMSSQYITELAKKLMVYCSYIDSNSIAEDMFLEGCDNTSEIQDAFKQLSSLSLINRGEGESLFSIHRLVQLVIRNEQETKNHNDLTQVIFPDTCCTFKRIFINNVYSSEKIDKFLNYLPHILSLFDHSKRLHVFSDEVDSLQWVGKILHHIRKDDFYQKKLKVFSDKNQGLAQKYPSNNSKLEQDPFDNLFSNDVPEWVIEIAEKSHPRFQNTLGYMFVTPDSIYAGPISVNSDYKQAVLWITKAAKQGYPMAQNNLGHLYSVGHGVEKSHAKALKWYTRAASQGYAPAQKNIGMMYAKGEGVEQNFVEAVKWLTKAAEQEDEEAQLNLGVMYVKGQTVDQIYLEYIPTQYIIGVMYYFGQEGVKQSYTEGLKWITKAAEQGYAKAQCILGEVYANGRGVDQNYTEAFKWCARAAKQGDISAQSGLGWMYENGLGVDQNYAKAFKWYTKAAKQGYPKAQYILGCMYANGQGVDQNYTEAFKWYTKAAKFRFADAQYALAQMHENGEGTVKDPVEAKKWYVKAFKEFKVTAETSKGFKVKADVLPWYLMGPVQRRVHAQYNLGVMYYYGQGVDQNYNEAFLWYFMAAEQGHTDAQNSLGWMYENGLGVVLSYAEAFLWYFMAAEQEDPDAQNNLGRVYENGYGVEQNYAEAFLWYFMAAEQGHAAAQNNLGWLYQNGKGVDQNYTEAFKWFMESAEQEYADAQNNLGEMYRKGQGMPHDYAEAIDWYTKAADQGNVYAQLNFGEMHANGQGVPQSDAEAIKWFNMAADQGDEMAQEWLRFLHADDQERTHSIPEAVKCFTEAMDGDAVAQNKLGEMFAAGQDVDQNDAEAVKWFTKAADQGNIEALYNLGLMYAQGRGVGQSEAHSQRCFTKASAYEGNSQAQYDLGVMCLNGTGIEQSDVEALKWITLAAQQGNTDAQYQLGAMYAEGHGVEQSDEEARHWFTLATNQGHPTAPLMLKGIYNQY